VAWQAGIVVGGAGTPRGDTSAAWPAAQAEAAERERAETPAARKVAEEAYAAADDRDRDSKFTRRSARSSAMRA
jgi:hypothetical protein